MYTRKLSSVETYNLLLEEYFFHPDYWFFGIYDKKNHAFFSTADRVYLELDEPGITPEPEHEALLIRLENEDPHLLLLPRMDHEKRTRFVDSFIDSFDDESIRLKLKDNHYVAVDNWRPYSIDRLMEDMDLEVVARWNKAKRDLAEPVIDGWIKSNAISPEGIVLCMF